MHDKDGRIMPKNLPIMLFGIAMIFALLCQILCQNMPTKIQSLYCELIQDSM